MPGAEQALRKIPVNGSHERRKKWLENVLPLAAHFRDPLAFGRVTILIDVSVQEAGRTLTVKRLGARAGLKLTKQYPKKKKISQ